MEAKRHLRQQVVLSMKDYSIEELRNFSDKIFDLLKKEQILRDAKSVFCYYSFKDEVCTHELIKYLLDQGKVVLLPKIISEGIMIPVQIKSLDELKKSEYGIPAPESDRPYFKKIDVGIIPGLAFGKDMTRLGRGGGFYDKFLENYEMCKIGLCYDFQLFDTVPTQDFDKEVNFILSSSGKIISN